MRSRMQSSKKVACMLFFVLFFIPSASISAEISVRVLGPKDCKSTLSTQLSSDPSQSGFVVRDECSRLQYFLSFDRYRSIFNNPNIRYGPFGRGDQLPKISEIKMYGSVGKI